jgi:Ca-activated chloride channel family protein
MTRRRAIGVAIALAMVATSIRMAARPQEPPAGKVQILAPAEGEYVSGPTLLRARVEPPGSASTVVFSVDGRQICAVTRLPYECEWNAGSTIIEHQIRVVASLTGGGRAVQTVRTRGVEFAESVEVDVVQVTATVSDSRDHFVKGLPRSVFHVFEDGKPQTISHFSAEDSQVDLVVAVDISNSMTPAMPKLKAAVKEFLSAVPAQDQVTLLGFNNNIFTLTRRSTDPAERVTAVDRLAPWGATALYDVIIRGVELLGKETGRKSLIVFTDGEDEGSHAPIDEVERRLQASDVTLYMIGQGRGTSREPLKKIMQRLAQPTGGRALFTEKIDELKSAFAELLDELSHQYLLGYEPTNSRRDDTFRRIKVDVEGHYQVRARRGYRATAAK